MASNKELTDAILKLDKNAAVDGLNNPKLESLLASLSGSNPVATLSSPPAQSGPSPEEVEAARLAKAEAEALVQARAQAEANAATEAARKGLATHKLAPGKAVTCKRDVVADGDSEELGGGRVSARDFHCGAADIVRLEAAGVLVAL